MPQLTFTERLECRRRLWWDRPRRGSGRGVRDALHRFRERDAPRSREMPEEDWRCCENWPRTLVQKWNGREYAARHGCALPELRWRGRKASPELLDSLAGGYAIRPEHGSGRDGVVVVAGGVELLRDGPGTPEGVSELMMRSRVLRRSLPVLVEERIPNIDSDPGLPLEVKAHVFGATVGLMEHLKRLDAHEALRRYYSVDWEPLDDPINSWVPLDDARDPPVGLERIVELSSRLGAQLGTYMRIDFFVTADGPVFNEFSTLPLGGKNFTPLADEMFGALWSENCPDAV